MDNFRQHECGERSLRRRLQNDGATARNRGGDLVGNQVQRKIEWSDGGNWAHRKSSDNTPAPCSKFLKIEWYVFSTDSACFFRGDSECEDGAIDLSARGLDGLPCFEGHGARELLTSVGDSGRDLPQNTLPLERRQSASDLKSAYRSGNSGFDLARSCQRNDADAAPIERRLDLAGFAIFDPAAINKISALLDYLSDFRHAPPSRYRARRQFGRMSRNEELLQERSWLRRTVRC